MMPITIPVVASPSGAKSTVVLPDPTATTVTTPRGLKLPAGKRVRGVNIAPTFDGMGGSGTADNGSVWSYMWRSWNWTGRMQPQLDDAAKAGNAVRLFGNTHVIATGNITMATYLARWKQFLDYCVTKNLWVYPCGGDFGHWGSCNATLANSIYGQLCDLLAGYTNIIGFDITNEAWGQMHPNNQNANSYNQPQDYRDLSQSLVNLVHARLPGIPVTNSFSLADNTWWNWDGPVGNEWAPLHAMSDFLDFHVYTNATAAQAASAYQRPWATGKNMVIGEFGRAQLSNVKSIVTARTDNDGALFWACWDLGSTLTEGLFDDPARTPRQPYYDTFLTYPVTK